MLERIDRYELRKRIGVGGQATVYLGEDTVLGRTVAVKVMNQMVSVQQEYADALMSEARLAAGLSHQNIATVYDFKVEGDAACIVMEYVPNSLDKDLKSDGPMPSSRVIDLAIQICDALDYAHSMGFVHRDIKPHNILLAEDGLAKVTDFGIARATDLSSVSALGTPLYMSPEQCQGEESPDIRSDIYSIGVTLYEMLTGQPPFDGNVPQLYQKHVNEPMPEFPPDIGVPSNLAVIVRRCMEKDPENRYQSASDVASDLRDLTGQPSAEKSSNGTATLRLDKQSTTLPLDINSIVKKRPSRLAKIVGSVTVISVLIFLAINFSTIIDSAMGVVGAPASPADAETVSLTGAALGTVAEDSSVNFPDTGLDAAIRQALGKGHNDRLTKKDLEGLTMLEATGVGITNLTNIENLTNLTELYLQDNQITDVSPLQSLTNLEFLNLSDNQIRYVIPLSSLVNLKTLHLGNNQLSDHSPLQSLTQLTFLSISNTQISDLSPLESLTNLRVLHLIGNQISDVSPLQSLNNLTELYLNDNLITDISPVNSLPKLTNLEVLGNPLSDPTPVPTATSIPTVTPVPTVEPSPTPIQPAVISGVISLRDENGISSGVAWIEDETVFELPNIGNMKHLVAKNYGGHRVILFGQGNYIGRDDDVWFAQTVSANYNRCLKIPTQGDNELSGYGEIEGGITSVTDASVLVWEKRVSVLIGTADSDCYRGVIFFKAGDVYGALDPVRVAGSMFSFSWYVGQPGQTDFSKITYYSHGKVREVLLQQ